MIRSPKKIIKEFIVIAFLFYLLGEVVWLPLAIGVV
jgi:hypothetical protein